MIGELTSKEKIRISARLAVLTGQANTANPYPAGGDAHKEWALAWTRAYTVEMAAS